MSEDLCLWCFKRHKDKTKIKRKHARLLQKIREGELPCNIGGCRPYLCTRYQKIIQHGLQTFGSCNELLADLNRVDHFLELLNRKS